MTNTSSDDTKGGFALIIASVVFFVIIALLWALQTFFPSFTGGITAKKSAVKDLGNAIVVFSFISLALQSALGVFVNNWRRQERNRENREVERQNRRIENLKQEIKEIKLLIQPNLVSAPDAASEDSSDSSPQPSQPTNQILRLEPAALAKKTKELENLKEDLKNTESDLKNAEDKL